ncbi:hypothetical protein JCM24511_02857 [Saitozyma sp. JCM 24511]|nr:hypothetical protein JCM24511_02857 [Saitozyma sp. JCM 24511]
MSYPYLARTTLKYKSPHATDLSFAKDETIRVTGPSPDDEDWLVGETLDGSKQGGFPKDFITPIDEEATSAPATESAAAAAVPPVPPAEPKDEPVPSAPAGASETAPTISAEEPSPSPVPTTVTPPTAPHLDPKSLPHSTATTPVVATPAPPSAEAEGEPPKQSMKDRLAFFAAAQNKAAPPPPVKPKPATGGLTWSQRQKLRQEQEAKEREAGGAVSEQPVAAPTAPAPSSEPTTTQTQAEPEERGGMSAADAQSSITKGGSLKERMAALQGAGAFGSPAAKPPPPPKPSGKVWTRPAAPPEPEPEDEPEETAGEAVKSSEGEAGGSAEAGENAEADEPTEEEQEKARRAAIAARMAKLGARGPMGMPPPKPARKPTREATDTATSPPLEGNVSAPTQSPPDIPDSQNQPLAEAISPPPSVAMPAIPRRTAGPRRRGPATPAAGAAVPADREEPSEADNRLERVNDDGTISPPPQVMVADEEKPLPKTEEALRLEQEEEAAGRGPHGAEGAAAAGIAMTSEGQGDVDESDDVDVDVVHQPVVGALGTAGSDARGVGVVGEGEGEIFDGKEDEPEEIEEGLVEGGDEKDEIMQEAEEGYLAVDHGAPTMVPVHPPAEEEEEPEEEETAPPPPPRMRSVGDVAKDEVERKHDHDAQEEEDLAEEEAPPPPPRRISTDRPLGPRPLPTAPSKSPAKAANPLPPPPAGNSMVPPRDDEEDEREAEGLGDEDEEDEPAPPPPPRKPSMPAPLQIGVPTPAAPTSPVARSPTSPNEPAQEDSEEASRRSGIAARMAKLGGIKFGMPPPGGKKPSASSTDPMSPTQEAPTSPVVDAPKSPIGEREVVAEPVSEQAGIAPVDDGEETPEQEAARRRATLARLRAGGALGFGGMFGHGPSSAEPQDDERGIEQEEEAPPIPAGRPTAVAPHEEDDAPPPPARPPVPGGRPMPPAPATEEDVAPPPPARQASISRPVPPPPADDDEEAPPPPARPRAPSQDVPPSPVRAGSVSRPPVPSTEKRRSLSAQMEMPAAPAPPRQVVEEPTTILEDEAADAPPPPPPNRPAPQIQTQLPQTPRRSMSSASRTSKLDSPVGFFPASRQASRQDTMPAPPAPPSPQPGPGFEPRQSFSQARPGFNELQAASRDAGVRLARAARGMFDQGKKAYYGDGSPAGFVLLAMENAQLPRPQQAWGLVVFEQEAASVLKRHDEPRPGDIAAFHDAKLKGKKGLQSYTQQVGSVEDPLVGVVIESEAKKHKLRVLQVERGVPEEVSYRCDDLKSGRVVVYRPGI